MIRATSDITPSAASRFAAPLFNTRALDRSSFCRRLNQNLKKTKATTRFHRRLQPPRPLRRSSHRRNQRSIARSRRLLLSKPAATPSVRLFHQRPSMRSTSRRSGPATCPTTSCRRFKTRLRASSPLQMHASRPTTIRTRSPTTGSILIASSESIGCSNHTRHGRHSRCWESNSINTPSSISCSHTNSPTPSITPQPQRAAAIQRDSARPPTCCAHGLER